MHRLKCATDPRDKIYAIVGNPKAVDDPDFVIDYKLSAKHVFINTVDYVLRKCCFSVIIHSYREKCPYI